jgi:hypothetical protein
MEYLLLPLSPRDSGASSWIQRHALRCKGLHGKGGTCECRCPEVCVVPILGCAPLLGIEIRPSRCNSNLITYAGVTELWKSLMCVKDSPGPWFKKLCLMGKYNLCGVRKLQLCPMEMDSDDTILWRCISYIVVGKNDEGQDKKAPSVEYNEILARDLISYMKPKLTEFITHNFIAQWQDCKFKEMLKAFPKDAMLSCIDFSENYTMMIQNEIQSMYGRKVQVTILVHISYCWNAMYDVNKPEYGPEIMKELHYYLSDDNSHDTLFVQHSLMLHWRHVRAAGILPRQHIVWSDGCSG